jgi:hypothetical protein
VGRHCGELAAHLRRVLVGVEAGEQVQGAVASGPPRPSMMPRAFSGAIGSRSRTVGSPSVGW